MIEYHGWITLFCADQNWADDDWDAARQKMLREIARFSVEDGHAISFGETTNSMQTVLLNGHTDEDIKGVVRFIEFVGGIVRDSYGELVVFDEAEADLSTAARYRLAGGRVLRCGTNGV